MSTHGLFLTVIAALLNIFANLLLRQSVSNAGFSFSIMHFLKLFFIPKFILGMFLYFASMVVWFRVLATEMLSSCYPILVGISFFGVTLCAVIFFKESLQFMKIAGIITILLGIVLIARA